MSKFSAAIAEQFGATIVKTVAGDVKVKRAWLTLGQDLFAAGVTVTMLTKGTEKEPNEGFDEDLYATTMGFILAGVTAGNPGKRFPFPTPGAKGSEILQRTAKLHVWTAEQIVGLDRDQMNMIPKTIEGNEFRDTRDKFKSTAKMMMNRVIFYINNFENPEKARAEKKAKADTKAAVAADNTAPGYVLQLDNMMAHRTTIGLSAAGAEEFGNALSTALVVLRREVKAAEKKKEALM